MSGLPADVTVEEFTELMKKCGIIAENDDGRNWCVVCTLFLCNSLDRVFRGSQSQVVQRF